MKYKLFVIFLISLLLTGCYNYRELNDLAIISAIGISKEEDNIKLTIQVLDTNDSDTSNKEANYIIFNTRGKTIQEALRNVMNESSKRLYINHMQVLILSSDICEEGINNIIDFFYRDPESRKQYLVLTTNDEVEEILKTRTLLEKINGKNLKERIEKNSIFLNDINKLTFTDLMINYLNPNKELVISSIKLDNDKLILDKTAIFNNDKLVGYIDNTDTIYYNFIQNKIDDTLLTFKLEDKYISIEVISNKTNIDIDKDITINLNIDATINDINNIIDLDNKDSIIKLENELETNLNKEITNSISNIITKYNVDIYGFKDMLYKNNKLADNFDLNKLKITVNSKIKLTHKGNGDKIIYEKN